MGWNTVPGDAREFPRLDETFQAAQGLFRLKPDSRGDRGTKLLARHHRRVHVELEAVKRQRSCRHGRLPVHAPLVLLQPGLDEQLHGGEGSRTDGGRASSLWDTRNVVRAFSVTRLCLETFAGQSKPLGGAPAPCPGCWRAGCWRTSGPLLCACAGDDRPAVFSPQARRSGEPRGNRDDGPR